MVYEIDRESRSGLIPLFETMHDTMIRSCLEGHMGIARADHIETPKVAQIIVGDFVFLAGDAYHKDTEELLEFIPLNSLVIAENKDWQKQIEHFYKEDAVKIQRYAFKQNLELLKPMHLKSFINQLPKKYELKRMEGEVLKNHSLHTLSKDFTSQFDSLEDFAKRGRGYCILDQSQVVCGASSYSIYDGGLEIEVDTHFKYRRNGLATIAVAALILECLDVGIYPNYDAANLASVGVAQKLGYKLDKAYDTYFIQSKAVSSRK